MSADSASQRDAYQSISGITGHAKGAYSFDSPEALHANMRSRFAHRPKHAAVVAHAGFETYLAKRGRELAG
jgi:hypothetical protein